MKKHLGILTLIIVMSGPAWAWDNFSVTVGNDGVYFGYENNTGRRDAYSDDGRDSRRHRRERRLDRRIAKIDRRMERQAVSARDGRKSGDLTPSEFRRVKAEQRRIREYRKYSLGDGRLSQREWKNLTAMLDQAGEKIARLRSNRRTLEKRTPRFRPYARNW